jgi:hypothetical protein
MAPGVHFGIGQNFGGEPFTMAIQGVADAPHIANVGANAVNHGPGFQRKQAK